MGYNATSIYDRCNGNETLEPVLADRITQLANYTVDNKN